MMKWLEQYRTTHVNFGLERMERMLALRGNPHLKIPVIHIAGTNGKGSTIVHLAALLQKKGLRVATFMSPYVVAYNEQIQINRVPISENRLQSLLTEYEQLFQEQLLDESLQGVTEFEILTAIAYDYFCQERVDVAIIEVGMGGLLDSTNVCQPVLTAITTIGMDHVAMLGDSLTAIAAQKAGIIKSGVPVITGNIASEALRVIHQVAMTQGSLHIEYQKQYAIVPLDGERFNYCSANRQGTYRVGLAGTHQMENAALALALADRWCHLRQEPLLSDHDVMHAFRQVRHAARLETICQAPYVILDGAHNHHAMKVVAHHLHTQYANKTIHILLACIQTKALEDLIQPLIALDNVILTLTTFADERAVSEKVMRQVAERYQLQYADWHTYLANYLAMSHSDEEVLLITGSLYFISQVRPTFITK